MRSRATHNMHALMILTCWIAIQRVGMAAYSVNCGNIACRSCCDWNEAPTDLLLRGCLHHKASPGWVGEIYQMGFKLLIGMITTQFTLANLHVSRASAFVLVSHAKLLILPRGIKGEEKSGNLPIPFWFTEFGIILHHINGMLILCCHVQCTCTCRFW